MFLQDTKSIRCWLSKEMKAASRTLRLAVVVLNSLLTGLFPIPCTSCCLEHIWLADSLHAWPQLRGRGLHGSVEAPDPYGATVHLWKSVTDFYIFPRMQSYVVSPVTANTNMNPFSKMQSGRWIYPWRTSLVSPLSWPELLPSLLRISENSIRLPKPESLEERKIIWTWAFHVPHSFRQPVFWFPFVLSY